MWAPTTTWRRTTKGISCSLGLRPGEYTVYVYSEDTSGTVPPRDMAVVRTVTIESPTETVVLDTLTVYKDL